MSHTIFGLSREALIEDQFFVGTVERVKSYYPGADVPGLVFLPSALGVELFLWVHGKGDLHVNEILNPTIQLTSNMRITTGPGIRSTTFPERTFPRTAQAESATVTGTGNLVVSTKPTSC